MKRPRRIGTDGNVYDRPAHERRRSKQSVWTSLRFRKARIAAFDRDGYLCHFCGYPTKPGDRKLKPTAAHWPLSVAELLARGLDPTDSTTIVTAHASCHGRDDATRQHA